MIGWLELRRLPVPPPAAPPGSELVFRAWNMLGGLDWAGLEIVCEVLGVEDPDHLIAQLVALRDNPELLRHG